MKLYKVFWKNTLKLVLVQWYNFKLQNTLYKYECPYIKLVEIYNIIEVDVIQNTIHIIPRFDRKNEYYVNNFII